MGVIAVKRNIMIKYNQPENTITTGEIIDSKIDRVTDVTDSRSTTYNIPANKISDFNTLVQAINTFINAL